MIYNQLIISIHSSSPLMGEVGWGCRIFFTLPYPLPSREGKIIVN
jgi:hypothetical protein